MSDTYKTWYKKWWGITLIMFLALILIFLSAFSFYVFDLMRSISGGKYIQTIPDSKADPSIKKVAENTDGYWIGSSKPKITIVEFADFECPYCKQSYATLREAALTYKNVVKLIFRDYPVHENSLDLAMAARCAGEQGLFWPMHDKLFANQGNLTAEKALKLAIQTGVNKDKYSSCIATKKYQAKLEKDYSDAETLGVSGTPTLFINGYKIEGDVPSETLRQIIENLLK
jgi:protein-disulfide isomerase